MKFIKNIKLILIFTIFSALIACSNNSHLNGGASSKESENLELMNEGIKVLGDEFYDLRPSSSSSSYSYNTVVYSISDHELSLKKWSLREENIYKDGWLYLTKKNQSYIYCKDKIQLEVVPPQSLIKNEILEEGDMLLQGEKNWHIGLSITKGGAPELCDKNRK